jgi:hypothetical protein
MHFGLIFSLQNFTLNVEVVDAENWKELKIEVYICLCFPKKNL